MFDRLRIRLKRNYTVVLLIVSFLLLSVAFLFPSENNKFIHYGGWISAVISLIIISVIMWSFGLFWAGQKAKNLLKTSLIESKNAVFLVRVGNQIIQCNDALYELIDTAKLGHFERLENLSFLAKVTLSTSQEIFSKLKESASVGTAFSGELEVSGGDGNTYYWQVSVNPVGAIADLSVWTINDITSDKILEHTLAREREYIGGLLEQLPVGFFSADANGYFQYVNKTLADWLSIDDEKSNFGGLSLGDFIVRNENDDDEVEIEPDTSGMHGGLKLQNNKGAKFSAFLIQSQKDDDNGRFEFSRSIVLREPFIPVVDDGTGVQLLRRIPWLFSDSPVGIVFLDLNGTVLDCNKSFLKILGLHRDGVVGRSISERIAKEDRDGANAALAKVAMKTMRAVPLEVRVPTDGEREITASFYVSGLENSDGEVTGLVLHVTDLTDEKTLEVQFNQAQKMQTVGQLAGGVAHNFNNLLTAMGGFCDLLLSRHTPDDSDYSDIMQIKENAENATTLVGQLLAFSRRQTLEPKIFSIAERLEYLTGTLHRMIGENIEIELVHGQDVDLIRTDRFQFDHVIYNLSVNARYAMPGGGVIRIVTENVQVEKSVQRGHDVMPPGEYIRINFSDTGSGIAPENINRIFEPFFTTKKIGEGTGLGLSTVYGIIRQSDGYIFVDSAVGEGTTFSIYLPAFSSAEIDAVGGQISKVGEVEVVSERELMGEATVLLVEDEDAVRVFGSRALKNKGYRVLEAEDGEQALDVINQFGGPIDLIITDVMMPGMDGHTLVKLVQEELPDIKVILMSGYAEDAILGEVVGGEINFLPKPFSLNQLAKKVKEVISF